MTNATVQPKDYLSYENDRNRQHAQLYVDIVKDALGCEWAVLVGHHILYEKDGNVETEGEIPSADTLMFDHEIMTAVFGSDAIPLMQELVAVPASERDAILAQRYEEIRA